MSKVNYSGIAITESSGKVGDYVYSRNRGGHFRRAYVVPTDPATADQLLWRSDFAAIASIWQLLPEDARQQWNKAADSFYRKNSISSNYRLSGYNYFIQQTLNILLADGAPTYLPVLPTFIDEVVTARVVTLTTASMIVRLRMLGGATVVQSNMKLILFATAGVSQGIFYKRTGFAGYYSFNPTDSTFNIETMPQYLLRYPVPSVGDKIFFRAVFYHSITGVRTEPFYFSGIVS